MIADMMKRMVTRSLWLVLAVDGVFTGALLLRRRDPELLSIGALLSQSRASSQSSTS